VGFVLTVALVRAVDAVDDLPLLSPLLQLVGLGYSSWFTWSNLLFARDRQRFSRDVQQYLRRIYTKADEALHYDILGEDRGMAEGQGQQGQGQQQRAGSMSGDGAVSSFEPLGARTTENVQSNIQPFSGSGSSNKGSGTSPALSSEDRLQDKLREYAAMPNRGMGKEARQELDMSVMETADSSARSTDGEF
jgi:hypothetical protein